MAEETIPPKYHADVTPKWKADDKMTVTIGRRKYTIRITKVDNFGSEPHYGFYTLDEGRTIAGWIPCAWFDQLIVQRDEVPH